MSTICMLNIRQKRSRQQVQVHKIYIPSNNRHSNRMASQNCTRMHAPTQHSFAIVVWKISWHLKSATRPHPAPISTPFKKHLHLKCAKLSPNGSSRWVFSFNFFNGVICVRVVNFFKNASKQKVKKEVNGARKVNYTMSCAKHL